MADPTDSQHGANRLIASPVVVVSDLHLGHPATYMTRPSLIEPLIDGARTVVFNGDTCELLNLKNRPRGLSQFEELIALCRKLGARPVFLTRNHDPQVSTAHSIDFADGRVFITHGDVLHPWLAPWASDAPSLRRERERLLHLQPEPQTWEETVQLAKRIGMIASRYDARGRKGLLARVRMVGKFAVEPWRIFLALHYWSNVSHYSHGIQAKFRPKARLMLIGHTHRAGVWTLPDFTLVNTGSYQPLSEARIVQMDESRARVLKVERGRNGFSLGREVHHVHYAD